MAGDIGVAAMVALMGVMLEVIDAEADGRGHDIGHVGEDRHQHVGGAAAKDQAVGGVMNDDIETVIGKGADGVSQQKRRPPVRQTKMAHAGGQRHLQANHADRDQRGPGIAAVERAHMRIGGGDGARTLGVRLLVGNKEAGRHYADARACRQGCTLTVTTGSTSGSLRAPAPRVRRGLWPT